MKAKVSFPLAALFVLLSGVSFFQIDSAAADKYSLNPLFWICGIVSGLIGGFLVYVTYVNAKK